MYKAKTIVRLAQIEFPPTRVFQKTIGDALGKKYSPIVEIEADAEQWSGVDLPKTIEGVIQTAADMQRSSQDALFTAYIMPTAFFTENAKTGIEEPLTTMFIGVRNSFGNEWFFAETQGQFPVSIVDMLSKSVDTVLEKRKPLCNPALEWHEKEAEVFVQNLEHGISRAFAVTTQATGTIQ